MEIEIYKLCRQKITHKDCSQSSQIKIRFLGVNSFFKMLTCYNDEIGAKYPTIVFKCNFQTKETICIIEKMTVSS